MLGYVLDRELIRGRILRLPAMQARRHRAAAVRQRAFQPVADLDVEARNVLDALNAQGVTVLPAVTRLVGDAARMVDDLIAGGSAAWAWGNSGGLLETDTILRQNPGAFRLGLHPVLLDLAENYLREPCFYMGCSLKREIVSPSSSGTRQWHLDIEDDRMLRLILYLNDVTDGGGPFQYIPASASRQASDRLAYRSGYVSDATMRSAVSEDDWNSAHGAAGALVAFDGTRVFHRAARPVSSDRLSLSLTYTSRHPRQVFRQVRLRSATVREMLPDLGERERRCLPDPRRG